MMFVYGLLLGVAIYMIWQDVKYQTVPVWCLILLGVVTGVKLFYEPNPDGLWAAFSILFIFASCQGIFYFIRRRLAMGWGDSALGPLCGLWLYVHEIPSFLVYVGIIGILTGLVWRYRWRMRTFPFVPAILGGQGIVFLIRCFLKSNGI
jgi:prepilin signal peptidase PulO-like enzyme (type II secretory pathway)